MGNVTIRQCKGYQDYNTLQDMYSDQEIASVYGSLRRDRIAVSNINILIYLDDIPVGFILCFEKNNNINNIDIGVLKQYCGLGVAKRALKILFQLLNEYKVIEVEVSKRNKAIPKILKENEFIKKKEEEESDIYIRCNK